MTPREERLARVAKFITDADELVTLLRRSIPAAKPWQRTLLADLAELDRLTQVLRLTISLGREDSEVLCAAAELHEACRRAGAAQAGSRIDHTTLAALKLVFELTRTVQSEISALAS